MTFIRKKQSSHWDNNKCKTKVKGEPEGNDNRCTFMIGIDVVELLVHHLVLSVR